MVLIWPQSLSPCVDPLAGVEGFIRTLKENLLWVQTFETVEQLRQALLDFRETYNGTWLIERHGFQPPAAICAEPLPSTARAA
jgi:putative transposase